MEEAEKPESEGQEPKQPSKGSRVPRIRLPKPLRKVLVSAGVLLALILTAGTLYTWYMDKDVPATEGLAPASDVTAAAPMPRPQQPAPNAPVGVAVEMLTSPASPGSDVTMAVRTTPTATCTISVMYGKVPSKAAGLSPQIANEYGAVGWDWIVDTSAPHGSWPVKVTCRLNKQWGVVQANLDITA